jgi:predicted nucleic acid-binding protein
MRDKQLEIIKLYETFFKHPGLTLQIVTPTVIERALKIRVEYGLKTPDCIQAACALQSRQSFSFVTADTSFSVVKELNVVLIED